MNYALHPVPSTEGYVSIMLAQNQGSCRDGYGYRRLDAGRALVAWVADAPDDALLETACCVERAVDAYLGCGGDAARTMAAAASEWEVRILLADLVTCVGDSLCNAAGEGEEGGSLHCAATFAWVSRHGIHVLSIGDCAAYVFLDEPDACYRLSGTTRLDSRMRLDLHASMPRFVSHVGQTQYLGGYRQIWAGRDVECLPLRGVPRMVLLSDGPERQCGPGELLALLERGRGGGPLAGGCMQALEQALTRDPAVDDLTLLAFDACLLPEALKEYRENVEPPIAPHAAGEGPATTACLPGKAVPVTGSLVLLLFLLVALHYLSHL